MIALTSVFQLVYFYLIENNAENVASNDESKTVAAEGKTVGLVVFAVINRLICSIAQAARKIFFNY